jgi:hypothetical protein
MRIFLFVLFIFIVNINSYDCFVKSDYNLTALASPPYFNDIQLAVQNCVDVAHPLDLYFYIHILGGWDNVTGFAITRDNIKLIGDDPFPPSTLILLTSGLFEVYAKNFRTYGIKYYTDMNYPVFRFHNPTLEIDHCYFSHSGVWVVDHTEYRLANIEIYTGGYSTSGSGSTSITITNNEMTSSNIKIYNGHDFGDVINFSTYSVTATITGNTFYEGGTIYLFDGFVTGASSNNWIYTNIANNIFQHVDYADTQFWKPSIVVWGGYLYSTATGQISLTIQNNQFQVCYWETILMVTKSSNILIDQNTFDFYGTGATSNCLKIVIWMASYAYTISHNTFTRQGGCANFINYIQLSVSSLQNPGLGSNIQNYVTYNNINNGIAFLANDDRMYDGTDNCFTGSLSDNYNLHFDYNVIVDSQFLIIRRGSDPCSFPTLGTIQLNYNSFTQNVDVLMINALDVKIGGQDFSSLYIQNNNFYNIHYNPIYIGSMVSVFGHTGNNHYLFNPPTSYTVLYIDNAFDNTGWTTNFGVNYNLFDASGMSSNLINAPTAIYVRYIKSQFSVNNNFNRLSIGQNTFTPGSKIGYCIYLKVGYTDSDCVHGEIYIDNLFRVLLAADGGFLSTQGGFQSVPYNFQIRNTISTSVVKDVFVDWTQTQVTPPCGTIPNPCDLNQMTTYQCITTKMCNYTCLSVCGECDVDPTRYSAGSGDDCYLITKYVTPEMAFYQCPLTMINLFPMSYSPIAVYINATVTPIKYIKKSIFANTPGPLLPSQPVLPKPVLWKDNSHYQNTYTSSQIMIDISKNITDITFQNIQFLMTSESSPTILNNVIFHLNHDGGVAPGFTLLNCEVNAVITGSIVPTAKLIYYTTYAMYKFDLRYNIFNNIIDVVLTPFSIVGGNIGSTLNGFIKLINNQYINCEGGVMRLGPTYSIIITGNYGYPGLNSDIASMSLFGFWGIGIPTDPASTISNNSFIGPLFNIVPSEPVGKRKEDKYGKSTIYAFDSIAIPQSAIFGNKWYGYSYGIKYHSNIGNPTLICDQDGIRAMRSNNSNIDGIVCDVICDYGLVTQYCCNTPSCLPPNINPPSECNVDWNTDINGPNYLYSEFLTISEAVEYCRATPLRIIVASGTYYDDAIQFVLRAENNPPINRDLIVIAKDVPPIIIGKNHVIYDTFGSVIINQIIFQSSNLLFPPLVLNDFILKIQSTKDIAIIFSTFQAIPNINAPPNLINNRPEVKSLLVISPIADSSSIDGYIPTINVFSNYFYGSYANGILLNENPAKILSATEYSNVMILYNQGKLNLGSFITVKAIQRVTVIGTQCIYYCCAAAPLSVVDYWNDAIEPACISVSFKQRLLANYSTTIPLNPQAQARLVLYLNEVRLNDPIIQKYGNPVNSLSGYFSGITVNFAKYLDPSIFELFTISDCISTGFPVAFRSVYLNIPMERLNYPLGWVPLCYDYLEYLRELARMNDFQGSVYDLKGMSYMQDIFDQTKNSCNDLCLCDDMISCRVCSTYKGTEKNFGSMKFRTFEDAFKNCTTFVKQIILCRTDLTNLTDTTVVPHHEILNITTNNNDWIIVGEIDPLTGSRSIIVGGNHTISTTDNDYLIESGMKLGVGGSVTFKNIRFDNSLPGSNDYTIKNDYLLNSSLYFENIWSNGNNFMNLNTMKIVNFTKSTFYNGNRLIHIHFNCTTEDEIEKGDFIFASNTINNVRDYALNIENVHYVNCSFNSMNNCGTNIGMGAATTINSCTKFTISECGSSPVVQSHSIKQNTITGNITTLPTTNLNYYYSGIWLIAPYVIQAPFATALDLLLFQLPIQYSNITLNVMRNIQIGLRIEKYDLSQITSSVDKRVPVRKISMNNLGITSLLFDVVIDRMDTNGNVILDDKIINSNQMKYETWWCVDLCPNVDNTLLIYIVFGVLGVVLFFLFFFIFGCILRNLSQNIRLRRKEKLKIQ